MLPRSVATKHMDYGQCGCRVALYTAVRVQTVWFKGFSVVNKTKKCHFVNNNLERRSFEQRE